MARPVARTRGALAAVAASVALACLLAGCSGEGDSGDKSVKASVDDGKSKACADWSKLHSLVLGVGDLLGASDAQIKTRVSDLYAAQDAAKDSFAEAAKSDSTWVSVQEALYEYTASPVTLTSGPDPALAIPIQAACDRV